MYTEEKKKKQSIEENKTREGRYGRKGNKMVSLTLK